MLPQLKIFHKSTCKMLISCEIAQMGSKLHIWGQNCTYRVVKWDTRGESFKQSLLIQSIQSFDYINFWTSPLGDG